MTKIVLALLPLFALHLFSSAQAPAFTIRGNISDAYTNERLTGVTVSLAETRHGSVSALDGSYLLRNVAAGTYRMRCKFLGYEVIDTTISVKGNMVIHFTLRSSSVALQETVIAGKQDASTDAAARRSEQHALNITNIVSAKAIQLSPDITIANVLQRVSGVSVERSSSGDGRYAIIRGMDQRYNYTLINGIKIPSPDNKNRYVPLDIFPADLVERIEVNKTLTPDMEGDAIGGTVNMVMKNAPARQYLNASLSTGYNQTLFDRTYDYYPVKAINKQSPYEMYGPAYSAKADDFTRDNLNYTSKHAAPNLLASLAVGNRFLHNKLGIMLGGTYQHLTRAYSSIFNPAEFQEGGALFIKHAYERDYSTRLSRTGLNAKIDYNFNNRHRISLYNVFCMLDEAQTRMTRDTLLPAPRTEPGTGQVWYYGRSKYQRQTINSSSLKGTHNLMNDRLTLNWTAVYSLATNRIPDWAEYEYDGGYYRDPSTPNNPPYQHPNVLQNFNRAWWRNKDRDIAGYLDLAYTNKLGNIPYTLSAGGMYRSKHRDNHYDNYELRPIPDPGSTNQIWRDIYQFKWTVFNPKGTPGESNNYRSNEKITAGYLMAKFSVRKLETTVGVRVEDTEQDFETDVPVTEPAKTGSNSYMDVLPGIHFKYRLDAKTNLRLSYFGSITRPGFFEVVPYNYDGDNWKEQGNPMLQHTTAHNLDLRYEYFPKPGEQFLAGAFYKRISNPIEYGFTFTGVLNKTVYQPNNFGDATNFGFEVVYEKYIRNFGIRANYTYTNSSITTTKMTSAYENGVVKRTYPEEKRPLQGQSAHIANAALLYKNIKKGIDVQLTWQFTGKRIVLVSPYYGFDYWQKDIHLFDLSAEKKIVGKFAVFAKVQNLLNTPYEVFILQPPVNTVPAPHQDASSGKTLAQRDYYGQNYQFGLRYVL